MKITARLLSILSVLFMSFYFIFSKISAYQETWKNFGKQDEYREIYIRLFEKADTEIYESLTNFAKNNNVNLIKTDMIYLKNSETTEIINSVFLTNPNINLFKNTKLVSGNFFDTNNTNEDLFLSTKQDSNAAGKLYDFFEANNVKIGTLLHLAKQGKSLKGTYTVRYNDKNNFDGFVKDLSKNLDVPEKEITEKRSGSSIGGVNNTGISKMGLIVCVICSLIASIFYSIKNLKNAGIMKLCGWNLKHIFLDFFGITFTIDIIFTLVFNFLLIIFCKNIPRNFIIDLFLHQLFAIFIVFLGMIPSLLLLKRYKISDLIADKKPIKIFYAFSFFVKQIIIIPIIIMLCFIPSMIRAIPEKLDKLYKWNQVSDFAVSRYVGNNDNAFVGAGGEPTESIRCKKILTYLNENYNAIFARFENLDKSSRYKEFKHSWNRDYSVFFDDETSQIDDNFKTLKVSTNYLDKFSIKNINGDIVKVDKNKNSRVVLRPKSCKYSEEAIKQIYRYNFQFQIDVQENVNRVKYEYEPNVEILTYDDSGIDFFTFHNTKDRKVDNNACEIFEKSLFIEVVPLKLMTINEASGISWGEENSALKVDIENKTALEFSQDIAPELEKMGVNPKDYEFKKIKDVMGKEIDDIKEQIMQVFLSLLIFLAMIILISVQSIKMYIETNKKSIAIKKIHGWTLLDRYKINTAILLICNLISIFLASALLKALSNPNSEQTSTETLDIFLLGILFIILDSFISYLIVKFQENKKISNTIKGA